MSVSGFISCFRVCSMAHHTFRPHSFTVFTEPKQIIMCVESCMLPFLSKFDAPRDVIITAVLSAVIPPIFPYISISASGSTADAGSSRKKIRPLHIRPLQFGQSVTSIRPYDLIRNFVMVLQSYTQENPDGISHLPSGFLTDLFFPPQGLHPASF